MRHIVFLIAGLLPISAHAQDTRGRPMDQMQGDCSNFATDLDQELAMMRAPVTTVSASISLDRSAIAPQGAFELTLNPQDKVQFPVTPARERGNSNTFAGIVSLGDLPAGLWRISADNGAWIDLVAEGKILASPEFEMQTKCAELFKTVVFEQPHNSPTFLQISGSRNPAIRITVTRYGTKDSPNVKKQSSAPH